MKQILKTSLIAITCVVALADAYAGATVRKDGTKSSDSKVSSDGAVIELAKDASGEQKNEKGVVSKAKIQSKFIKNTTTDVAASDEKTEVLQDQARDLALKGSGDSKTSDPDGSQAKDLQTLQIKDSGFVANKVDGVDKVDGKAVKESKKSKFTLKSLFFKKSSTVKQDEKVDDKEKLVDEDLTVTDIKDPLQKEYNKDVISEKNSWTNGMLHVDGASGKIVQPKSKFLKNVVTEKKSDVKIDEEEAKKLAEEAKKQEEEAKKLAEEEAKKQKELEQMLMQK